MSSSPANRACRPGQLSDCQAVFTAHRATNGPDDGKFTMNSLVWISVTWGLWLNPGQRKFVSNQGAQAAAERQLCGQRRKPYKRRAPRGRYTCGFARKIGILGGWMARPCAAIDLLAGGPRGR